MSSKKGRKKKADDPFYIKVTDDYRVARDSFNVIVTRKIAPQNGGAVREGSIGFCSTLDYASVILQKEGVTADAIENFKRRTAPITTSYEEGRLIIRYPADFAFDERDITPTEAA
ncbi:MAG: hypothetical protein GF334_11005 [Candidatus Altiarchaeales archaeon]|nr:hypothetical protein [Candidatus Altiarchaeales archaeon]